jgi:hypothetical protein
MYIFSQFIAPTCFDHFWPSSGCAVTEYSNSTICAIVQDTFICKYVIQNPIIVLYVAVLTWPPHSHLLLHRTFSISLHNLLILVFNIQQDDWVFDDIFINKYILDYCTCCWITELCNSAPWWWSKVTETCRCNELRKYISFVHFVGFH